MIEKKLEMKIIILYFLLIVGIFSFSENNLDDLIKEYYNMQNKELISIKNNKGVDKIKKQDFYNIYNNSNKIKSSLEISQRELMEVAQKIYQNETGGKKENLVVWNSGENFPSLGIGHFIWAKFKGSNGIFGESFSELLEFYKKRGIKLPKILEGNRYSPWKNRHELLEKKENGNKEIQELIEFFDNTREIQILYIYDRLKKSLGKMLEVSKNKENLEYQFYRVANSKNGLYALIDYVNFKGEGIATSPRYRHQGWGLRQVLENMRGKNYGKEALVEFSESAKFILERRIKNAPRNEKHWLPGWNKRLETYKN